MNIMKKHYDLKRKFLMIAKALSFVIVLLLCGCNAHNNNAGRKFSNIQQNNFDKMLSANNKKFNTLGNKILENEFNDSVKLAIGKYMDSVKLFVNWKANIQRINSDDTGTKSIVLSFVLKYSPEEYREVSFDVNYIIPKDSVNSDKIYQTIKNISDYSTVYFDGFIRTKANGEAYYNSYSDDIIHSYPDFNFFIVDINTESKGDTLPDNLKKAVDLSFEAIEPLKLKFRKEISKEESNKRIGKIAPKFQAAKDILTKDERAYIDRLTQALTLNFLYAQ